MPTYQELLARKQELDKTIDQARRAESVQALTTIKELIATFGFTAQQVFPFQAEEKKKIPARYYDPESGRSWTGRGKMPTWLQGKDLSMYEIAPSKVMTQPVVVDEKNPFPIQ